MTSWLLKMSKTKLSLWLPIVMILPLYIFAYINIDEIKKSLFNNAKQTLESSAKQAALRIDLFLKNTLTKISSEAEFSVFADFLLAQDAHKTKEVLKILNLLKTKDETYIISYGILNAQGKNIIDTVKDNIGQLESDQWYFKTIQKNIYQSIYQIVFEKDGSSFIAFVAPIIGPDSKLLGILRVKYSSIILQVLLSFDYGLAGKGSFGILLNQYNLILANSKNPNDIYKFYIKPQILDNSQSLQELILSQLLPPDITEDSIVSEFHENNYSGELLFKASTTANYDLWKIIYFQANDTLANLIYKKVFKIILYTNLVFVLTLILAIIIVKLLKALQNNQAQLNQAHKRLEYALQQEQRWSDNIKKDLELSAKVQDALLTVPIIPSEFDLFCNHIPARYLSGDTYFVSWDNKFKILTVILVDVVGKGVQAALKAAAFQQIAKHIWHYAISSKQVDYNRLIKFANEVENFLYSFPSDIKDFNAMIGFELYVEENKINIYRSNYNYPIFIKEHYLQTLNIEYKDYHEEMMMINLHNLNTLREFDIKSLYVPNKKSVLMDFYPGCSIILTSDGYINSNIKLKKLLKYLKIHFSSVLNTERKSQHIYSLINDFDKEYRFKQQLYTDDDDKTIIILSWKSLSNQNYEHEQEILTTKISV